jgi:hypothetical protein
LPFTSAVVSWFVRFPHWSAGILLATDKGYSLKVSSFSIGLSLISLLAKSVQLRHPDWSEPPLGGDNTKVILLSG